jgi:hypothetical protein
MVSSSVSFFEPRRDGRKAGLVPFQLFLRFDDRKWLDDARKRKTRTKRRQVKLKKRG